MFSLLLFPAYQFGLNHTGAQLRHNDLWIFTDPLRTFNETLNTTSQTLMEKCQDTHKVKIIMERYLFLSLIVDIVIKVIADS